MFNPVHHHCHLFTDFYKRLICAEPKTFFIVRKSDTFILWRACLLVVPAGLDPRTYSIGTLQDCINIMVIADRLSKMVKCIPMDGITAKDAAKVFYIHIWKNHGLLSSIIFDRGRTFVNYFWDQLTARLGMKTNLSTAYLLEMDGQTEILNSILEQYLKTYVNFLQNDWAS